MESPFLFSWFISLLLRAVYYEHLPAYNYVALHTDFASQLESLGLWKWAIFVLLHLDESADRQLAVQQILTRQCGLDDDSEDEKFLVEKLLVPAEWIFEAKVFIVRLVFSLTVVTCI